MPIASSSPVHQTSDVEIGMKGGIAQSSFWLYFWSGCHGFDVLLVRCELQCARFLMSAFSRFCFIHVLF